MKDVTFFKVSEIQFMYREAGLEKNCECGGLYIEIREEVHKLLERIILSRGTLAWTKIDYCAPTSPRAANGLRKVFTT